MLAAKTNASCMTIPTFRLSEERVTSLNVVAVDGDTAFGDVIEPWNDVGYRALAGAGTAKKRDDLSGFDYEIDVSDCASGFVVTD